MRRNAFRTVSKYLKAKVVLVTNVFRDQLDRYGEVSHTLSAIQESVNNLPEATLVINGDCSLTNTLKRENTVTYGVSVPSGPNIRRAGRHPLHPL